MNDAEKKVLDLARRRWPYLLPSCLCPVFFMAALVAGDVTHLSVLNWAFPLVVLPCMFGGAFTAHLLQRRENLSYGDLYGLWLVPPLAIWLLLIFTRAAILIPLGRPL